MTPWLAASAVAALAGSPHCIGMCGPLACAAGGRLEQQIAYHVGKLTAYVALGALAGTFGGAVPGPPWLGAGLAAVMLVIFAASLGGLVPEPAAVLPSLSRLGGRLVHRIDLPSRILFGIVNGLLPCGLVYATLSLATSSGSALYGAATMAVFGLCTVPALAVATTGARRLLSRSLLLRRGLAVVLLVSGLGAISTRTGLFSSAHSDDGMPPCHAR